MLDTQQNAESTGKKNYSELKEDERSEVTTKVWQIDKTPFQGRWIKDMGYAYGIGTRRVSRWFKSEEEMTKEIKKTKWDTLVEVIDILVEYKLEAIEIEKRVKENQKLTEG